MYVLYIQTAFLTYKQTEQNVSHTYKLHFPLMNRLNNICLTYRQTHTWQTIVFIQPGMQEMSITICDFKVSVDQY